MAEQIAHIHLHIEGMHCASCSALIQKQLSRMPGITSIMVNLATEDAQCSFNIATTSIDAILQKIASLGFHADVISDVHANDFDEQKQLKQKDTFKRNVISLITSSILTLLAFFVHNNFLACLCILPVQFVCGFRYYKGAWYALRARSANMDTLVATGTTLAFVYSCYVSFFPHATYMPAHFAMCGMLICFMQLGKLLEEHQKMRANSAIDELVHLMPRKACVIRENKTYELPVEQIHVGDLVLARPGDTIAFDGVVCEGKSSCNEAALTGEARAVQKEKGDEVFSATHNIDGFLTYKVEKSSNDSLFAHVISLVHTAQNAHPRIQRTADRIASYFVPCVLICGLTTFLVWILFALWQHNLGLAAFEHAIMSAISVVVVACPCALGLATPTAIMVATGLSAQHGVLIKEGQALENLGKIDCVVFDKTGTLTEGKPCVKQEVYTDISQKADILSLVYALSSKNSHPLSCALTEISRAYAKDHIVDTYKSISGRGVYAEIDDDIFYLGNQAFLQEELDIRADDTQLHLDENALSSVYFASKNQGLLAAFSFQDTVRLDAEQTIQKLNHMGITSYLLTGDTRASAQELARKVHIDAKHVIAEVLPQQKIAYIQKLQEQGKMVCMVGDGINDTPALAQANVGIALAAGNDAALESGHVVLTHNTLQSIVDAVVISRKTMRKIHQNFAWALGYNAILIPLAAFGVLHPGISALCMALSSVTVVSNSLLLRKTRLD